MATAHLPADEAYEIRDSIAAHIAEVTGGAARVDDDAARRIVRDLGPVSSVVGPSPSPSSPNPQPSEPPGRTGYAALACGVVAAVLFPLVPVSVALGIVAILLGVVALRKRQQVRAAIAGIVLGTVAGIVIPVAFIGVFTTTDESSSSAGHSSVTTSYYALATDSAP